ncbi:MAG TPA: DoxX family protein [Vicinamibacterales bacterium]|jgi:uncharacterized membrane protein YphA (DoxX/SURF4 family)|nr:DoxX family protein [Vicinamibacterales bacterium]
MRKTLFLLGRAIFGGYFVYTGVNHFLNTKMMSGYAASKGTPAPDAAVLGTGALMIAGGASVLAGMKPRNGLAALIGFLIPASFVMHGFWKEEGEAQHADMVNFTKNMALVGAMLMLMQLDAPWPVSAEGAVRTMRYLPHAA